MEKGTFPKNNSQGLKRSQGKSGSFFISTDDNKYMIKSLKSDEIDLIRNGFLAKYIRHIQEAKKQKCGMNFVSQGMSEETRNNIRFMDNQQLYDHGQQMLKGQDDKIEQIGIEKTKNESLLCRLYGMFNIMMAQGQEFLVIVMRNVIGDFKDNTVVKFDLKGSTYNRKANFDMDNANNSVMKDLNFDEIEKNIMISESCINKLRDLVKQDSKFLCRSELMDYSLFLVKLTLNKEEAVDIFGEDIIEEQNKALKQIFTNSDKNKINNSRNKNLENEEKDDMDDENGNINIGEILLKSQGQGKLKDIRHYHQYLFPSLREGAGYIIAIIDYFQYFNFFKVVEANIISKFKTGFNKEKNNTVSCVKPNIYSERFIRYFNTLTDISKIKEFNQNNELQKIDEEEENNIDNENEEDDECIDVLGNLPNLYEDKINVDLNEKQKDEVNFNLRITIVNRKLIQKNSFIRKSNANAIIKRKAKFKNQ